VIVWYQTQKSGMKLIYIYELNFHFTNWLILRENWCRNSCKVKAVQIIYFMCVWIIIMALYDCIFAPIYGFKKHVDKIKIMYQPIRPFDTNNKDYLTPPPMLNLNLQFIFINNYFVYIHNISWWYFCQVKPIHVLAVFFAFHIGML
jgi:hypothetical protein